MTDLAGIKARATLPTRTVALCVAGELVEQRDALLAQLAAVKPATSLGDDGGRRALLEQIAALDEQMRDATVEFRLRALPARAWTEFWGRWPTRRENETAEAFAARRWPAYLEVLSRSCVEPALTVAEADELAEVLHGSAWSELISEAVAVNMGDVDIPNFDAASAPTGTSAQT